MNSKRSDPVTEFVVLVGGPDTHMRPVRLLTPRQAQRTLAMGPWYLRDVELGRFPAANVADARRKFLAANPGHDASLRPRRPGRATDVKVPK